MNDTEPRPAPPPGPAQRRLPARSGWIVPALGSGLLLAFLAQALCFEAANSQTSDEGVHLAAGYSYLLRRDFRLNPEHPPLIKELAALAVYLRHRLPFEPDPELWRDADQLLIGRDFLYANSVSGEQILSAARLPTILLGTLLVALVGLWSYRLWGGGAALLGMALASFEPNLIAHASLVTTDLGVTLFTFLSVYLLWEYTRAPSERLLLAIGVSAGLALATKFSAILLGPIFAIALGVHILRGGSFALPRPGTPPDSGPRPLSERLVAGVPPTLILLVLAAAVVVATYLLREPTWLQGLLHTLRTVDEEPTTFFFGQHYPQGVGWPYFPAAFLIKTPLGSLLLIGAGLLSYGLGRRSEQREALFLLVPVAVLLAVAATSKLNLGVRHVLPIYPFLFVVASRLAALNVRPALLVPLLALPALATAASSLRVAPHQLAYFNEAVGGPDRGHHYLSDSNIDWCQGLKGLRDFVEREEIPILYLSYFGNAPPEAYGIRHQHLPAFGRYDGLSAELVPHDAEREILAISVFSLHGMYLGNPRLYQWLWEREPIAKIGYSIFLYDITGDAEAHAQLARVYTEWQMIRHARWELQKVRQLDPTRAVRLQQTLQQLLRRQRQSAPEAASPPQPADSLENPSWRTSGS